MDPSLESLPPLSMLPRKKKNKAEEERREKKRRREKKKKREEGCVMQQTKPESTVLSFVFFASALRSEFLKICLVIYFLCLRSCGVGSVELCRVEWTVNGAAHCRIEH